MPPGGSSPSPAQLDRGGALVGGGGGGSGSCGGGGGPPHLGDSDVPRSIQKTHPPSFILSGCPFSEVIAQGCNWIAVIGATGNTKYFNLSINRGGPRQADPDAGERGGGSGLAHVRGQGAQAGRGSVHLL